MCKPSINLWGLLNPCYPLSSLLYWSFVSSTSRITWPFIGHYFGLCCRSSTRMPLVTATIWVLEHHKWLFLAPLGPCHTSWGPLLLCHYVPKVSHTGSPTANDWSVQYERIILENSKDWATLMGLWRVCAWVRVRVENIQNCPTRDPWWRVTGSVIPPYCSHQLYDSIDI